MYFIALQLFNFKRSSGYTMSLPPFGYSKFFGTADQPNKPARSAVQVAALVAPGALLEVEVIAAKRHETPKKSKP